MKINYIHPPKYKKNPEYVVLLSTPEDISLLEKLGCNDEIFQKIQKNLNQKQSSCETYYLGNKICETLRVIILFELSYREEVLFLGKYLPTFWKKLTLLSSENKIKVLFEVTLLSKYSFDQYKSQKETQEYDVLCSTKTLPILQDLQERISNIFLARDLGNTPACDLTPEKFAQRVKKTKFRHVKVKILSFQEMQKQGLGLISAVGKWSENKPCMVILEYIRNKKKPIFGIVGKWITFDTGWNQIKPGDSMYAMKGDMGWAAVSFAALKEIDRKGFDTNIVLCLMLAENVVSENAYKPSDIYTSYSGKTVEIIHTDAEGRLILADGISFIGRKYKTQRIISIATLTGACVMALWYRYAGIMGTDDAFIESCLQYGQEYSEQYVRLPFDSYFLSKTKSEIADFKNLDRSVHAGASMGAAFLANFLENNEKYTHIDIAGTYINESDPYGKMPKTMTGFWVETLVDIFEKI